MGIVIANRMPTASYFFGDSSMTKRPLLKALLAALALTGLASVAQAQTTPIKFQLDWRFEGPAAFFLVPAAKGYFKDAKLGVVDAQGQTVPPGQVGEIVVRSPSLMQGYLGRPRETARFLKADGMHTGDLGHLDAEGYLHFDGRSQAFTKCAAQMVDLAEIEAVLRRHPQVSDARAMVRFDPLRGEHLEAAVVLRPSTSITSEALLSFLREHLSAHKWPRAVQLFQRDLVAATSATLDREITA